jgi:hypothetical protein
VDLLDPIWIVAAVFVAVAATVTGRSTAGHRL